MSCPKCKAELSVPAPEPSVLAEAAPRRQADGSDRVAARDTPPKPPDIPAYLHEIATALPAEVADLRPEDLRVEAEFFESLTRTPERPADPEPLSSVGVNPNAPLPSVDPQSASVGGLAPLEIALDSPPARGFHRRAGHFASDIPPGLCATGRCPSRCPADRDRTPHHPAAGHRDPADSRSGLARRQWCSPGRFSG